MRILQACVRYPPAMGGVEAHVRHLSQRLAARGHEVTVVSSDLRSEFPWERLGAPEAGRDDGPVRVIRFPATTAGGDMHWPYLRGLDRWLLRHAKDFDLIHAHSYGFHHTIAALGAARLAGKPFVLTPHFHPHWSMELGPRRRLLRAAFDALAKRTLLGAPEAIVCVSRAEAELLGAPRPERIHFIPNGVDPQPFAAARGEGFRQRMGIDGPAALFVGRLAANKGLFTLLEAWKSVQPQATLLIAGDGHMAAPVRELARVQGFGNRVRMLGALPDAELAEAYAASDLLVLPSEYEAFGIVLLEAMAAGKPVIATRAGGVPEVVQHDKTGLLVPVGDSRALASAMDEVLRDAPRARAMGAAGRGRLQEGYTWEAVAARVEDLYAALLRAR